MCQAHLAWMFPLVMSGPSIYSPISECDVQVLLTSQRLRRFAKSVSLYCEAVKPPHNTNLHSLRAAHEHERFHLVKKRLFLYPLTFLKFIRRCAAARNNLHMALVSVVVSLYSTIITR